MQRPWVSLLLAFSIFLYAFHEGASFQVEIEEERAAKALRLAEADREYYKFLVANPIDFTKGHLFERIAITTAATSYIVVFDRPHNEYEGSLTQASGQARQNTTDR